MVESKSNEVWPIVYRKEYNVKFFGLETFHPFDSKKWGHIYKVSKFGYETYDLPSFHVLTAISCGENIKIKL